MTVYVLFNYGSKHIISVHKSLAGAEKAWDKFMATYGQGGATLCIDKFEVFK